MSEVMDGNVFSRLSESQLARIVKEGSDPAFEEMAGRYIKFISSLATGFSADGFDKNDFVQEGLLILLAACKTYDEQAGTSFKNYLSLCVRRRYISIQRRSNKKGSIPQSSLISIDEAADSIDYSLNPEELLINKEYLRGLISGVEKNLSPLEQNVLSHYLAGYTYAEIAEKTGICVKSVGNALQRVRKKFNS